MSRPAHLARLVAFGLVLALSLVFVTPAHASEALCIASNGTWDGPDGQTGTCTYASAESITISSCGSDRYTYIIQYVAAVETDAICKPNAGGGFTAVVSDGAREGSFTMRLKNGKGYVTFANGCESNCSINSTLPNGEGKATIYVTPLATLYVRAGSSTNAYTVCFQNTSGGSVRIYRYAGGIWTPVSAPSAAAVVCAAASGDGSFYLH